MFVLTTVDKDKLTRYNSICRPLGKTPSVMGSSFWDDCVLIGSCSIQDGEVFVCAENVCADDVFAENLRRTIKLKGNYVRFRREPFKSPLL